MDNDLIRCLLPHLPSEWCATHQNRQLHLDGDLFGTSTPLRYGRGALSEFGEPKARQMGCLTPQPILLSSHTPHSFLVSSRPPFRLPPRPFQLGTLAKGERVMHLSPPRNAVMCT